MFLLISMVSAVLVLASALFAALLDSRYVPFFNDNVVGRIVNVLGHAPLILTVGVTVALAIPFAALMAFINGSTEEAYAVWLDYTDDLGAIWEWFTVGVPDFIVNGR